MVEKNKHKTLSERLYNVNVLPIANLRGTDITDVVLMNIQDKADDSEFDITNNSEEEKGPF